MSATGTNIFAKLSQPKFFITQDVRISGNGELSTESKKNLITRGLDLLLWQDYKEDRMVEIAKGIAKLAGDKPELFRAPGVDIVYFSSNLNALKLQVNKSVEDPAKKTQIIAFLDQAIASATSQLKFNRYVVPVASFTWNWMIKPMLTWSWKLGCNLSGVGNLITTGAPNRVVPAVAPQVQPPLVLPRLVELKPSPDHPLADLEAEALEQTSAAKPVRPPLPPASARPPMPTTSPPPMPVRTIHQPRVPLPPARSSSARPPMPTAPPPSLLPVSAIYQPPVPRPPARSSSAPPVSPAAAAPLPRSIAPSILVKGEQPRRPLDKVAEAAIRELKDKLVKAREGTFSKEELKQKAEQWKKWQKENVNDSLQKTTPFSELRLNLLDIDNYLEAQRKMKDDPTSSFGNIWEDSSSEELNDPLQGFGSTTVDLNLDDMTKPPTLVKSTEIEVDLFGDNDFERIMKGKPEPILVTSEEPKESVDALTSRRWAEIFKDLDKK